VNKEDADKWCEALRSGEYKQGQGKLYNEETDCYCCLGVLNKLMPKKYIAVRQVLMKTEHFESNKGWIPNLAKSLAAMNDNGQTFLEIADIIEEHYGEL
jgi:hypothetical protein